ncbi:MAG: C40 family peptidase [Eubacteriales bacterium]
MPENTISALRKQICDDALSYLGTPYRWGGRTPSGIDCSGLCFTVYALNGLPLWRDAYADKRYVHEIDKTRLQPGDLIYFKSHMALYIGDDEYVHASASTGYVTVGSLNPASVLWRQDLAQSFLCFAESNFL